jgi:O-antigen ligase
MGMSGSKDAYAAAIRTKCIEPKISMDHTHNGWIDTALSIGIPGVLIYAALMMVFIIFSFKLTKDKNQHIRAWATALLSLSILWTLRAIFDSVQRDQMLEIQSFFLPLAMACIIGLKSNSNGHNGLQT